MGKTDSAPEGSEAERNARERATSAWVMKREGAEGDFA